MLNLPNLQRDIILAPYTTYKIGGPADYFVVASNTEELINAIRVARENNVPYFILGTGANILFGDRGFRGLVIKNEAKEIVFNDDLVIADSGVVFADLIEGAKNRELSGLEHYAGIPSTVGGAVWQNLHFLSPNRKDTIFISSILKSAEILDEKNILTKVDNDFFNFGYDHSILHNRNLLVTKVTFELEKADKQSIQNQIDENLKWRNEKQPSIMDFPSCGSVFKKIEEVGAGRLIEKVGLKGYKIGGAQISEKHANFFVNLGNAKSSDIIALINLAKEKVKAELGYELHTEISFIGEF